MCVRGWMSVESSHPTSRAVYAYYGGEPACGGTKVNPMMNALREPQRIVVFGGGSELGLAIASELLAPTTHVCLVGPRVGSLQEAAGVLELRGATVSMHTCDARNLQAHEQVIADVFSAEVDVLIIASGVLVGGGPTPDVDTSVQSLEVNGTGPTSWLLRAHERMRAQGHGVLVVLSSFAIARARPSNWVYGAGKVMLDFATRGLLAAPSEGVDVVLVRPGFVHTKMTQGRTVAPFAVKPNAVARATSQAVHAGGSHIVWVPRVVKYAARLFAVLPMSVVRRADR